MGKRILIAEDDPIARELLVDCLNNWGYEVTVTTSGADAWEVLREAKAPKLAIVDWMMPGMNGIEVIQRLRVERPEPYTYVLLLTSRTQKQDVLAGLRAGADDYLAKPFDLPELEARLHVGRRVLDLQERLVAAAERAQFQAMHDVLTGLFNRRAILEMLEREGARLVREDGWMSVLMVDVDHFKKLNDTHGHLVGDVALQEVAQRIKKAVRPYDSVGRYGGEEFLAVAPGCRVEDAPALGERIRRQVSETPLVIGDRELDITVSIGVSTGRPGAPATQLLRGADAALYAAKDAGRNRVEVKLGC